MIPAVSSPSTNITSSQTKNSLISPSKEESWTSPNSSPSATRPEKPSPTSSSQGARPGSGKCSKTPSDESKTEKHHSTEPNEGLSKNESEDNAPTQTTKTALPTVLDHAGKPDQAHPRGTRRSHQRHSGARPSKGAGQSPQHGTPARRVQIQSRRRRL